MSSRKFAAVAAVTVLVLPGCKSTLEHEAGLTDRGMGEAVAYAQAAQIINPDPVYEEGGMEPGASGAKAAAAMKRYRTDQVKRVERVSTSEVGQDAAGGGGPR